MVFVSVVPSPGSRGDILHRGDRYGDTELLSGALFLLGIAVWLIHLGRKPS